MSVVRSYSQGIREASLGIRSVLVLWIVSLAFAGVLYLVAARILADPLASSLSGDTLLGGSAADALLEFLTGSGPALGALIAAALAGLAFYQLVTPFLYGGVLSEIVRPREAKSFAASFWMGGGKYYGRFFRLSLASIGLWVPAFFLFVLAGRGLAALNSDPVREDIQVALILARVAAGLFLFFLVKMVLDYARIRIAVMESRSALAALGWAALFVLRKPIRTLGLYYLLGLTSLVGTLIYAWAQAGWARSSTPAVLAGFALAQIHILWRSWIKVAYQAAEYKLCLEEGR
jgi:hypothetical protein